MSDDEKTYWVHMPNSKPLAGQSTEKQEHQLKLDILYAQWVNLSFEAVKSVFESQYTLNRDSSGLHIMTKGKNPAEVGTITMNQDFQGKVREFQIKTSDPNVQKILGADLLLKRVFGDKGLISTDERFRLTPEKAAFAKN